MSFPPLPKEDLEHVLVHTRPLWEQLRGARIFVTGATGFFGIWLLETFAYANQELGLGAKLVGLSRDPKAFEARVPHLADHPSIRFIRGDVRSFQFPEGNFSHVIHAGSTSGTPVPPAEMLDTIIQGTRHTLDFAEAAGARGFLFVSSGAVYGAQPVGMTHIPEKYTGAPDIFHPTPVSAYGEGKRVGELLCSLYHKQHGIETTIARCFTFVGPHLPLDAHFAIGNFIRDAMKDEPITVRDGTPYRSYLYMADLAIWLWTILFKGKSCHPYNVGSNQEISIADLARTVSETIGLGEVMRGDVELLKWAPSQSATAGSSTPQPINSSTFTAPSTFSTSRYVPSVDRARSELGLQAFVSLETAIRKTAEFAKRHQIDS